MLEKESKEHEHKLWIESNGTQSGRKRVQNVPFPLSFSLSRPKRHVERLFVAAQGVLSFFQHFSPLTKVLS